MEAGFESLTTALVLLSTRRVERLGEATEGSFFVELDIEAFRLVAFEDNVTLGIENLDFLVLIHPEPLSLDGFFLAGGFSAVVSRDFLLFIRLTIQQQ